MPSKFELPAIALATIGVFIATQASAQAPIVEPAPLEAQAGRTTTFDIPAQPLAQALTAFGQQAGLQIAVNAAAVSGKSSSAVAGAMTAEQALQRLLAGTGVSYRFTSPNAVTVSGGPDSSSAVQLDPVRVQANTPPAQAEIGNPLPVYAGGNVARGGRVGELGNRDYMDTPFSTTTYTEKYIERNQARTLVDAVNDDPTIRPLYAQGAYDDRMQIRGFLLGTGDMSFNGLYGVTPVFNVDLAGIERIEVFRGPSAMLSGMPPNGAIGGTMNFSPKRATVAPITQLTARYASNGQFGGNIDFGRRFGPDDSVGLRLNAAFMGGNTSVSNQTDTLLNLTAGFDFRGENTRIDADIGYTNRNITGTQGGTFLGAGLQLPAAPNAQNNYYPSWLFKFVTETYGMLRFEHDFTPDITAYAKVGGRRTNGAFALAFPTITNSSGAITASPNNNINFNEAVSADTGVRVRFATGAVKHEAVVSGQMLSTWTGSGTRALPAFTSNIYAPGLPPGPNLYPSLPWPLLTSQQVLKSIGVIDAMSALEERIQLIGGVRWQAAQVSNWSGTTGQPTPGYDANAVTPSVSMIVRPWKQVSFYGNFIQALEQGPIAGAGLANAGQVFPPFVSTQFEAGTKLDLGNFGATLSAFQITRPSSFTNPISNSLVVDGQQRNRGIEFTMFGEPLPGLRPIGGFSVLEAIQTNTLNGTNNGKYAVGVPTFQANVGLDWETPFVRGLAVGGRTIYTGSTYLDPANLQPAPAWTRVDLSAAYTFERPDGKPVSLRAQVINVGNNNYWITAGGYLSQNQPRTVMISLSSEF
ncbi:TonB-dependent receptor [Reyranella soli]|uniref:TonB-dependent receptor n=1 Tax=Reyranella soli TaxID=1230389 RepID=A0A512NHZ1_9HYPH|nr:TonB-dependent receptor [Reyranella soli]GEP58560.1 TonB-dependent receptor [Reyranella soli]